MARTKKTEDVVVPSATNLPAPPKDDRDDRMRKYTISMTIRTVCFVLAVVLHGWLRWACVVLAVFLPYFAVVLANATNKRKIDRLGSVRPSDPITELPHRG